MHRRILTAVLCAALLLFSLPLSAAAPAAALVFLPSGDGTCAVSGTAAAAGDVVIPAVSPDGDTVTAIDDCAFCDNTALRRVTIPASVKTIGFGAFYGCTALAEITLPDGVTAVSEYTFCGCSSLLRVSLPEGLTAIGDFAFSGCRSLAAALLPASLRSVGACAFEGCAGLSAVTVPEAVVSVGGDAFRGCDGLGSILFLSPETAVAPSAETIPADTVIIAPEGSDAARYCSLFGRKFRLSDSALPTLSLTDAAGTPGGTVDLSLALRQNPGFNFIKIRIAYDKSALSLVSCEPAAVPGSISEKSRTVDVSPYVLVFASAGDITEDLALANLRFLVSDSAPDGVYPVSVSVEQCFDEDGLSPVIRTVGSSVTVETVVPGDTDGDGLVDGRDATLLLQYLAGWKVEPHVAAADVTGDGTLDGCDVTLLLQYLAEWGIVLGRK